MWVNPCDFKSLKMKVCLLSGIVLQANAFTISEKEASQILSRKPRENPQINKNSKFFGLVEGADDLERECIEGRGQSVCTSVNFIRFDLTCLVKLKIPGKAFSKSEKYKKCFSRF